MIPIIQKMLAPLQRRVALMVTRAVIVMVNDTLKTQLVQVNLLAGVTRDGVEHFQEYGHASNPHPGAEGLMLSVGGNQDHGIMVAVGDRRYRLTGLAEGEVALYDDQGQKVHLTRNGIVIDGAGKPIAMQNFTDLNITGTGVINQAMAGGIAKGCVQGDCLCPYTGAPHVMVSATVKGTK